MSAFDDLPPDVPLPPLDEAAHAGIQRVQDTGVSWRLADCDEAELVAVGLHSPATAGRPTITDADVDAAAQRLVARGLAEPAPWAEGRVRPAGGLLVYLQLVLRRDAHSGLANSWAVPADADSEQQQFVITVLTDVLHAGQATVEQKVVPVTEAPASVPVTVDLMRLDDLVARLVACAFGDDADNAGARETVVAFADKSGALQPSRLRLDDGGRGELESKRHGLLGSRTTRRPCDRAGFRDHLEERFMAAG